MAILLTELRNYLVAQGLVRIPSVAGVLPPLWLEPQQGVPAAGEGEGVQVGPTLVLGAFLSGGFPTGPYESWMRKPVVEFRFRANGATAVQDIEAIELAIALKIIDKRDYMLGTMHIIESEQSRPLQRLSSGTQGYDYLSSYWFEILRPGFGT